jgi:hypothetical protein
MLAGQYLARLFTGIKQVLNNCDFSLWLLLSFNITILG